MNHGDEHHFVQTNGITLHVVMAEPVDGAPIILLHGFPEVWFGWPKRLIGAWSNSSNRELQENNLQIRLSDQSQRERYGRHHNNCRKCAYTTAAPPASASPVTFHIPTVTFAQPPFVIFPKR